MPESKLLQPPVLDARLAAAAAYVRPGCVAADVGCDHGRLSVALAAQGKCRKIIASDIRPPACYGAAPSLPRMAADVWMPPGAGLCYARAKRTISSLRAPGVRCGC
ncbi:MAG: SAM-dependent methyltransferase [Ruthenibacterium lactatiformans]